MVGCLPAGTHGNTHFHPSTCAGTEVPVEYNTDAPLYSPFLAEMLNLPGGYLQLGFYISVVTGGAIWFNRFYRARALAEYVEAKIAMHQSRSCSTGQTWPMWNLGG